MPHRVRDRTEAIARTTWIGVTSGMAQPSQTPPALFDRALLHARQRRAQAQGEVTFLLDRVAEDMSDRLAAVMREFHAGADLWTPGEGLAALRARLPCVERIALDAAGMETLPFAPESLDLVVSALALQFVNDLPGVLAQMPSCAEAGRSAARRDDRWRQPDRAAAGVRRGGS
ncbi:hypothetical protein ACVWW4_005595 [Bradyrhizobium sp. LB7.1]